MKLGITSSRSVLLQQNQFGYWKMHLQTLLTVVLIRGQSKVFKQNKGILIMVENYCLKPHDIGQNSMHACIHTYIHTHTGTKHTFRDKVFLEMNCRKMIAQPEYYITHLQ
jgi:hypothetical protein